MTSATAETRERKPKHDGRNSERRIRLSFAGLAFPTPAERSSMDEAYTKAVEEQIKSESGFDPTKLPPQPPPYAAVFRDERGRHYILVDAGEGTRAVPFKPGIKADPKNPMRIGGFLPVSKFPTPAAGGEGVGISPQQQQIIDGLFNYVAAENQAAADATAQGGPSSPGTLQQLVGMLQQMGLGTAQQLLGQLLAGDAQSIEKALAGMTSAQGLGGMAGNMALGAAMNLAMGSLMGAWEVDDASSMGEQLAKHFTGQLLGPLQSHVQQMVAAQLNLADPAKVESLSTKIEEFFSGPTSSATLQAVCLSQTDVKGNAVCAASADVQVEGLALAREGDPTAPGGVAVYQGSSTVLTNKTITARMDSSTQDGAFSTHAATVFVGGAVGGMPPPPPSAPSATDAAGAAAGAAKGAGGGDAPDDGSASTQSNDEASEATDHAEPADEPSDAVEGPTDDEQAELSLEDQAEDLRQREAALLERIREEHPELYEALVGESMPQPGDGDAALGERVGEVSDPETGRSFTAFMKEVRFGGSKVVGGELGDAVLYLRDNQTGEVFIYDSKLISGTLSVSLPVGLTYSTGNFPITLPDGTALPPFAMGVSGGGGGITGYTQGVMYFGQAQGDYTMAVDTGATNSIGVQFGGGVSTTFYRFDYKGSCFPSSRWSWVLPMAFGSGDPCKPVK